MNSSLKSMMKLKEGCWPDSSVQLLSGFGKLQETNHKNKAVVTPALLFHLLLSTAKKSQQQTSPNYKQVPTTNKSQQQTSPNYKQVPTTKPLSSPSLFLLRRFQHFTRSTRPQFRKTLSMNSAEVRLPIVFVFLAFAGCTIRAAWKITASLAKWLRRPPRERKVPGSNPACAGIFSGSSHTCDLNIGTPVATLPGAWRYRVSTGTGRPGVNIL